MSIGQKPNKFRCLLLFGIAMTENDITNEIWRRWNEQKITPPMTWQQLWEKVREYIKAGKDPYDILRGPAPSKEWMEQKGFVAKLPWPNLEPVAIVEEAELRTFAEWLLAAVKRVWKTKNPESFWEWLIEPTDRGVLVGLRGVSRPHELFPADLIEKHNPDKLKDLFTGRTLEGYVEAAKVRTLETFKGVTFYFETTAERDKAREFLGRHNFYFPDGPEISLTDIEDPDYMLELLAYEGFDTSKIQVER